MKLRIEIPLWLSFLGYSLFFLMVIGFTIVLPWVVPVSIIIATVLIGVMTWGIHRRAFGWLISIILGLGALLMIYFALSGFVYYVKTDVTGKLLAIAGLTGLAVILLGKRTREVEEFEKFIGFNRPLESIQRNGNYLLSKVYKPRPKSVLSRKRKKKGLLGKIQF